MFAKNVLGLPIVNKSTICNISLVCSQLEELARYVTIFCLSAIAAYILGSKVLSLCRHAGFKFFQEKIFLSRSVEPVKWLKPWKILYMVRDLDPQNRSHLFVRT